MVDCPFWPNMPKLREVILTSVNRTGGNNASEVRVSYDLLAKLKRFSARVKVVQLPKTLPPTLEYIDMEYCDQVKNSEALSKCRNSLRLSHVRLESPLALHSSITHLDITYQVKLPNLPPNLISLTYRAANPYSLPEALPAGLEYFDCSFKDWGSLPHLPSILKYLDCSDNKLDLIENLPSSLEILICDLNNLRSLAMLQSLKMLSCSVNQRWDYFSSLNSPPLPPSLKALSVRSGCHKGFLQDCYFLIVWVAN
ncbi:hypothetical protein BKA69DRAFT_1086319 [Paraphysoderma sedebokerense]|nr:hypothetical protein BKA69DRAFT_1086319 [Paraphysoderma sedebokerense]